MIRELGMLFFELSIVTGRRYRARKKTQSIVRKRIRAQLRDVVYGAPAPMMLVKENHMTNIDD